MEPVTTDRLVVLALALFVTGVFGVLWRRNLLVALLSLQLMLGASQLAFVAFGRGWSVDRAAPAAAIDGQVFALVALIVGLVQLVVGLAIVVAFARGRDTVDVEDATVMRW